MALSSVGAAMSFAGKLFFELIVVFLGVYLAFWVEGYREAQQEREQAGEIARVLDRDLADVIRVEQRVIDEARLGLQQWENERQNGGIPVPYYMRFPGSKGLRLRTSS